MSELFCLLMAFWKFQHFNLVSKISQKLFKPLPCHKSIGKMLHAICISAVAVSLRWVSCGLWASCFLILPENIFFCFVFFLFFFLLFLFFAQDELLWSLFVRLCIPPSVNIFKRLLLWSRWANFTKISYGASLDWWNARLPKWSRSADQDGRHAHIW